jgi:hypothetical protein
MKKKSFKGLINEAKRRDTYWVASMILGFTEGLHNIMEANGITRSDLARRLGVSPAYITKVLRGNVNPSSPRHKRWGLPLGQSSGRRLRVDPERRVKHRLKAEVLAPSKDQFHGRFDGAFSQGSGGEVSISI